MTRPEVPSTQSPDVGDVLSVPVPPEVFEPPLMDARALRYAIPWEWFDAVGIFFVWVVLQSVIGLVFLVVYGTMVPPTEAAISSGLITLILATLGWVSLRATAAGIPRGIRRAFGPKRVEPRDVALGIGYGLAAFLVVQVGLGSLLTAAIESTGQEMPVVQEEVQDAVRGTGLVALVVAFSAVILAPIGEELLFRGVLYQGLAKRVSGWPAIGLSGLAFGVSHRELLVIVLTFPLGMLLAWTLRRHGTLLIPILTHVVFNVIGVLLLRLPS